MSPERQVRRTSQLARVASRPHIAEWFGHRIFPAVSSGGTAIDDQQSERCPFLTQTLKHSTPCVKAANSRGVCTISASSNGPRQDWLVCPYRALDDGLLADMVCRLYGIPPLDPVLIRPVVALADDAGQREVLDALHGGRRAFVYFQDKLGGEISLSKTGASPELSFDITVAELLPGDQAGLLTGFNNRAVTVGKYGVIELQTTDTHGSYSHAVRALTSALDLHPENFSEQVAANPEWAGRKIEGPNISNVFKRTFYQIAFKFQVTKRETSVGCVLALPQPVWDSWQPFLGAPELHEQPDGTWRLLDDQTSQPSDWIYVFDIDTQPGAGGAPAPIRVSLVIGTDAATLSRAAFEVAPAKAVANGGEYDAVAEAITRRLGRYLPEIS
ncbi:MAG: hypothetical protein JOY82_13280 [Streptosporangiaceae bacterium]|nr:hypothetical protein [Streptosporangiaceae bacterium]MBV9855465.1 hypothetical protein [Streptosporangiaceae bacterium]